MSAFTINIPIPKPKPTCGVENCTEHLERVTVVNARIRLTEHGAQLTHLNGERLEG